MKDKKDIYQLLNEMDFNDSEMEEMEISEFDRAKAKKKLKASIRRKRKKQGWKMKVVAAVVVCGLAVSTLSLAFPAHAGNIPIIGDVFRFLDNGRTGIYDNYQEYSSAVNLTEESDGVEITINDAIYDGKTVLLTYSMESEKDLGEKPFAGGYLDIKGTNGGSVSNQISQVGENQYVGLITGSRLDEKNPKSVKVQWKVDHITIEETQEEIKGKWNFSLSLKASANDVQLFGQSAEQDGVKVTVDKISVTPMSFIVYYNQLVSKEISDKWHNVDVEIEVRDDLGNRYEGFGNGGYGNVNDTQMNWSKTFQKLDPNATKLIITPYVTMIEYTAENHGGVAITGNGANQTVKKITNPTKEGKGREEFTLEDIIIELDSN
ncbi:DUF4179 domain-containing protein [Sporosarcina sp. OR05]|uniref:DUF4179 domain-containing protein n=1 Tax=Sporosarcina sp. OR05 TaxID=2969819 RepID=UPI003529DB31